MDTTANRALTNQLADDLGWLEEHCRKQPALAAQAGQLRLAAALVRNCIGPFLDNQPATPLHIAVVGGAGAGKSTVANMLTGAAVAEANPQAGFTRHPIAYTNANGAARWSGHLGFLGRLQRLTQPSPSSLDADVYQVRQVVETPGVHTLLQTFVVWDCPDMTTWAATGYVPRLLEVAGLADVIVYVASDERYNDEVPTQFLQLLAQTGKPVVCCLTKMREADAPAFITHFQKEVLGKMPGAAAVCVAVPSLPAAQLADPARLAGKYRIPLLNQVWVLGQPVPAARARSVRSAANFLLAGQQKFMEVARQDVEALQQWRTVVGSGQAEFENRYRREYLTGEKFRRFDEALVRLLDLLELPGVGKFMWFLRTPYRLVKGLLAKSLSRPETIGMPELPTLEGALAGWLDMLRKEAAQRSSTHPLWAHVDRGFAAGLADQTRQRFQQGVRNFQNGVSDEIDRTARAIYEDLEKNPVIMQTLRFGKLGIDASAVIAAFVTCGSSWGLDFVLVPLAASITHQLVELLGSQYVDAQRELARKRQQALVSKHLAGPLAEWLAQWPATGGSAYERLQLALKRIPQSVQQIDSSVSQALAGAGK